MGRRKTVIIISILLALFALGCALATSLNMRIVMRFLLGLGVCRWRERRKHGRSP
ncbi:hypothetical protein ACMYSM_02420 [Raoultella planticola]|uniref:hypothetical protein n=1 Tax=Raoultella planticola TaxID=575 RepID=UPI003DA8C038